jgi:hypothetical protein
MPEHFLKMLLFSNYYHSTIKARDILGVRWSYFDAKRAVNRPDKKNVWFSSSNVAASYTVVSL